MNLTNADRAAIQSIIEQQIQAFRQNDADRAFRLASPTIRQQFETSQTFIEMVQASYDPLYRSRSVLFEDVGVVEGQLAQQMIVMGANGSLYRAYYLMQRQASADWRINGCYLTRIKELKP